MQNHVLALAAVFGVVLTPMPGSAHRAAPRRLVIGRWELNVAQSTFPPGPPPNSWTRTYEATVENVKHPHSPADADGNASDSERAATNRVTDAQFKKDRAMLERLLADDYLYTHSNGSVLNKAQEITESMSSDVQWTDSKLADLKVRIFGDAAVLTGRQTIQGTAKGYVPGPRRITDMFVKRSGRWQWAGGQATLEPTK